MVLVLTLWINLYGEVFGLTPPEGCEIVAYADDLELVVKAR